MSQNLGIEISDYKVQNTSNINKKLLSEALNIINENHTKYIETHKHAREFFDYFIKAYKKCKTSDDYDYLIEEIRIIKENNELTKLIFEDLADNRIIQEGSQTLYNTLAYAFKKGDSLKEYFKSSKFVSNKVEEILNYELTFLYPEFKNFLNNSSLYFEFENFLINYCSEDKESSHQSDGVYEK